MAYLITINEQYPIIESHFAKETRALQLNDATCEVLALAEQMGITMVIYDCSLFFHTLTVLYLLDQTKKMAAQKYAYHVKLALLMSATVPLSANARFWENICCNQSLRVKVFTDKQAAVQWLQGEQAATVGRIAGQV